jgi:hypothetical protein
MIELVDLMKKPSSPLVCMDDVNALKERRELYSGENFYFGFESSNYSFLNIINNHQPLGIKYGTVLAIYQRDVDGITFNLYWIDFSHKELIPLFNITGKPADVSLFNKILPFSFTESYLNRFSDEEKLSPADATTYQLMDALKQLTAGNWLDAEDYEKLKVAIKDIMSNSSCTITCADLLTLQQELTMMAGTVTAEDFVTPFCLSNCNPDLYVQELITRNPNTITLRKINNDNYPRIELIIPGADYTAVFEKQDPKLYLDLQNALTDTRQASCILREHFKSEVGEYLERQGVNALTLTL